MSKLTHSSLVPKNAFFAVLCCLYISEMYIKHSTLHGEEFS